MIGLLLASWSRHDIETAHHRRPQDGRIPTDEQRLTDIPGQRWPKGAPASKQALRRARDDPNDQGHIGSM